MKLIKRYTNRKLYDTERSCYVTLEEIAVMVRDGEDIQIIDNRSGEDLTSVTLAQIVLEEEKKTRRSFPLQTLQMMIRSPSDLIARLSRPVNDFREDAQRQVDRIRRRGETLGEENRSPLRDFVDNAQRTIDEMQAGFDDRLRTAVDSLTHVPHLYEMLRRLEGKVERLERENRRLRRELEWTHRILQRNGYASVPRPGDHSPLPGDE